MEKKESYFTLSVLAILGIAHFAFSLTAILPIVLPDEAGYLMNGAALAGFRSDAASQFYAGYSLFILPAFLVADSPQGVYLGVKLVNTMLSLGTAFLLFRLVRRLWPSATPYQLALVVLAAFLYPGFMVTNALAMSENAFVFLFVLSALLVSRLAGASLAVWATFGTGLGVLFVVHPRAIPVILSAAVVALLISRKQARWLPLLTSAAVVSLFMLFSLGLNAYVQEALTLSSHAPATAYKAPVQLVERLLDWDAAIIFLGNLTGQTLFLVVASFGAIGFGVAVAVRGAGNLEDPNRYVWLYLLLALLGTVLISAATLEPIQLHYTLYGRYNEAVFMPLLAVGFLAASDRFKGWVAIIVVAGVLALGYRLYLNTLPELESGIFNISALYYLIQFPGTEPFAPWRLFVALTVCMLLWVVVSRVANREIALALPLLLFAFTVVSFAASQLQKYSRAWQGASFEFADQINRNLPEGQCLNLDVATVEWREQNVYQFLLYRYPLKKVRLGDPTSFCSDWLLTSRKDVDALFPEARRLAVSGSGTVGLWMIEPQPLGPAEP